MPRLTWMSCSATDSGVRASTVTKNDKGVMDRGLIFSAIGSGGGALTSVGWLFAGPNSAGLVALWMVLGAGCLMSLIMCVTLAIRQSRRQNRNS